MEKKISDALSSMKEQVKNIIEQDYRTVEEFCWENDISKATVSNFLNSKKDFQVSTLLKIAEALDKDLVIRLK